MRKHSIKGTALLLCLALLMSLISLPALAQAKGYQPGQRLHGFVVSSLSHLAPLQADVTVFEHEKTGAKVMLLANEDTNRLFDISFRTPTLNSTGLPHIFEHATLGGSQKYPSKALFFNLSYQTYNTFMNAMTTDIMTTFPVASLSEQQLLRYADFYTDSAFNPSLMTDASIFLEEAWRYNLPTADDELTIVGTVYTEMQGASSIEISHGFNTKATLFPGSHVGNNYGGDPRHIPELSWQDLKDCHDAYYHPSNSLSILYGKFEDVGAFLSQLDGYFAAYDRQVFVFPDPDYSPLREATQKQFDFAVEAGSAADRGAVVSFAYVLEGAGEQDRAVLELLALLLNNASSPYQQAMKKQLPAATATCSYEAGAPSPYLTFTATGMAADEAELFEQVVRDSLKGIAQEGFDLQAVEAVAAATQLEMLLTPESASVGADITIPIASLGGGGRHGCLLALCAEHRQLSALCAGGRLSAGDQQAPER